MDALRNSLKVIFDEMDVGYVLKSFLESKRPQDCFAAFVDEQTFVSAYNKVSPKETKDQARSAFHLFLEKWMCQVHNDSFSSCKRRNVFNALLHFTMYTLHIVGEEPVCKFNQLLRWQDVTNLLGEDLFTTAYLASIDSKNRNDNRRFFSWADVIGHDNSTLKQICSKEIADVHNHLKGTGFCAELNWLSLMNDVQGRLNTFQHAELQLSKSNKVQYRLNVNANSLYIKVVKAAAIRLWLYLNIIRNDDEKFNLNSVQKILVEEDELSIQRYVSQLSININVFREIYGGRYRTHSGKNVVLDYAIPNNEIFHHENSEKNVNVVMSGERFLMYGVFKRIYREEDPNYCVSMLFYIYLLIKNELQRELVQTNSSLGFGNFADYEKRKEIFLKEGNLYQRLLGHTAIRSSIGDFETSNRYLETRISPSITACALSKKITKTDEDVFFFNESLFFNSDVSDFRNKWHYVIHFIKQEDVENFDVPIQHPRNWNVRKKVKKQSLAIQSFRMNSFEKAERLVGVDAANSELFCRPEVFAQGFRFLRRCKGGQSVEGKKKLPDLGMTYHVGEDFYDIVDGLRAVEEAIMFLEFQSGDRIGHGLVLGTDVKTYYENRNHTVIMPVQCLLDNVAYLLVETSSFDGFDKVRVSLEQMYEKCFRKIYGEICELFPVNTYYQSWLLRGDAPEAYMVHCDVREKKSVTLWNQVSLIDIEKQNQARKNRDACFLYHLYHFNSGVKKRGMKYIQFKVNSDLILLIKQLQECVLLKVERLQVSIECNPTSNFKIGEMRKYIEHPITKFCSISNVSNGTRHQLNVSINTDDKGVFATSLDREYALLAASCAKEFEKDRNKPTPREFFDWLDTIRQMTLNMSFKNVK